MTRTFRPADIFRVQRLLRCAIRLHTVQSLLTPRSPLWMALVSANLLDTVVDKDARVATYVYEQRDEDVLRAGLLQLQKRLGRPEADLLLLSPSPTFANNTVAHNTVAHDTAEIWQALLTHYQEAAENSNIARIYASTPDEPELVQALAAVHFRPYARQTIWQRKATSLSEAIATPATSSSATIRPQQREDDWGLLRLYSSAAPPAVQLAEGAHHDQTNKAFILDWHPLPGCQNFVLVETGKIRGSLQIASGRLGVWLQLWVDTQQPTTHRIHQLISQGLAVARTSSTGLPIYVGVDEYQGGVASVLVDYGFTPHSDIVKMVRYTKQRIFTHKTLQTPVLERATNLAPVP